MVILGYKLVDPSVMKVLSYSIIFLSKSGPITCFGGVRVFIIYAELSKSAQSVCSRTKSGKFGQRPCLFHNEILE